VKKIALVILIVALSVGFGFAWNSNYGFGPDGLDELEKQKGGFKTTLIRPDADFYRYSKLCPKRVLLQFRGPKPAQDESTTGSMVRRNSSGPAIPKGEDLETLRQVIGDAFASEIGSGEVLELVEEVGPETLYLRVMIMDIVTDMVSKSSKSGKDPKPFSAQGTIVIDLIDAETGIIQARFGEHSKSKKTKDPAAIPDAGVEWVDIWTWAEQAAADLRQELERVLSEDRS